MKRHRVRDLICRLYWWHHHRRLDRAYARREHYWRNR